MLVTAFQDCGLSLATTPSPSLCPTKAGRRPKSTATTKATAGTFEPLAESRAAWDQRYGPQAWNEVREWVDREVWE
jgi:hypothetical protein